MGCHVMDDYSNPWHMVWLCGLQAIADIVIATSLCLLLRHRRTGSQKTDSVINRMVLYTISTGLVTSVLACILLGTVCFNDFLSFFTVIMLVLA